MAIEYRDSGVAFYPEVVETIGSQNRPLVETYFKIADRIHEFYKAQVREGFYPPHGVASNADILQAASLKPSILDHHSLVRMEEGELRPKPYTEVPPFDQHIQAIADGFGELIGLTQLNSIPQSNLIRGLAISLQENFRRGAFDGVTLAYQNASVLPDFTLLADLQDRYRDDRFGVKLSGETWALIRDRQRESEANRIIDIGAQVTAPLLQRPVPVRKGRVISGDVVFYGGIAAEYIWNGNTYPSQDDLRVEYGSLIFLFPNTTRMRYTNGESEDLVRHIPQVAEIRNWDRRIVEASLIRVSLHEGVGHALNEYDANTEKALKNYYTLMKENDSEVSAQVAALHMPRGAMDVDMRRLVILSSLGWWGSRIRVYNRESDPEKKKLLLPYAQPAEIGYNFYVREGCIRVGDNEVVRVLDWDELSAASVRLAYALRQAVSDERDHPGSIEQFIERNRHPKAWLYNRQDNNPISQQPVAV